MGNFLPAVEVVFHHEGNFANDPRDSGGPTMMGVTLATMKDALGPKADLDGDGDVDLHDVRMLTREQAVEIYRTRYWLRPGFDRIPDLGIATKALDVAVHAGPKVSVILLQRAINQALPSNFARIKDDGVLGRVSLSALAFCDPDIVLAAFASEQAGFYLRIIERDPKKLAFKDNWLARAKWGTSLT